MTPDPTTIAAWLGILFFLVAGVNGVLKLTDRFRAHPPSSELKILADSIIARVEQLEEQREADVKQGSERRKLIYDELKSLRREFQEEIKSVYERVERGEAKTFQALHDLPNEIIATLRNTGALK